MFTSLRQVCTVVDDFEATVTRLTEQLGIGPFRCFYFRPPVLYDTTFRGKPAQWTMKLAITWLDDIQWEVIQPMEGASLYREHLEKHGRGVQHLLMATGDVPWEEAGRQLAAKGHPFAQTARVNPPLRFGSITVPRLPNALSKPANLHFGYIDAEASLRTCIELTRYPLGFSERFALRAGKPEFCIPAGEPNFEKPLPNLLVKRVSKIGILTRDLEATVRAYQELGGIGPWETAGGIGRAKLGDVLFEVVQPSGGPFQELLDTRGEGVGWVGVEVGSRLDEVSARLAQLGHRSRGSYWMTREGLGTDLELIS